MFPDSLAGLRRIMYLQIDRIDSLKLAKHLKYDVLFGNKKDKLPEVYVPKNEVRDLRSLFTTYMMNNKKKTMAKNRVHSLLKQQGLCLNMNKEDIFGNGYDILSKVQLRDVIKFQIQQLLNEIAFFENSLNEIKKKILEQGKIFQKEIDLLISIKGISVFTAIAIMTDIADINRFENAKRLCAYLGVSPTIDSSNKTTKIGGINKQSRKLTRTMLCQSVIHLYSASSYYTEFSRKLKLRKSPGKVRIAVIRKIITNIYRMLKDNKYFFGMDKAKHNSKVLPYLKFLKNIS
jgi:transposase